MYDVVELMVSYGSAEAPLTREAVRTSCVNLFSTRALVRFAEAGAETKTHSNSLLFIFRPLAQGQRLVNSKLVDWLKWRF